MNHCISCNIISYLNYNCNLCEEIFCSECSKPIKHVCKYLIQLDTLIIDPLNNQVSYKCPKCEGDIIKMDYKNDLGILFDRLDLIKRDIDNQVRELVDREYRLRHNGVYFILTHGNGEEALVNQVKAKNKKSLLRTEFQIWKQIIEIHLQKECGKIKKRESTNTKKVSSQCKVAKCHTEGVKLSCNRCKCQFCPRHLLPEIHKCSNVK